MWALVASSSILPLAAVYLNVIDDHSRDIVRTRESSTFVETAIEESGSAARHEFFRCHPGIQVHLATHRDEIAINDLAATLESDTPIYLTTTAERQLKEKASLQGVQIFDVAVRSKFGDGEVVLFASKGASGAARPQHRRNPSLIILTLLSIATAVALYGTQKYAHQRLNA